MKYKLLLSKQGVLFRILSIIIQTLLFLPLSFIISFFASSIIISYYDLDSIQVLVAIIVVLNLICMVRNSIVKVNENEIIWRNWIGCKQIIKLKDISSVNMINSQELKKSVGIIEELTH